tara:strand:+ start:5815 stop:6195 length:381 start_codon:yes stop_codon:yes gene_type:complete
MSKIIVAGGREFTDSELVEEVMENLFLVWSEEDAKWLDSDLHEVVCGEARGADTLGRLWAESQSVKVKSFPADWDAHGRAAGPIRNAEMGDYADTLVAFWDGKSKGTKNMIDYSLKKGLTVHVYRY